MSAAGKFDGFEPVARLKVTLTPDIELEQLQDVIARLYRQAGCEPCGRLSFTIEAINPELVLPATRDLRELPEITNIEVR